MENKTKIIIAVIAAIGLFALGRYTTPTKVKIEKQIVEVEKKTKQSDSDSERDKHKVTVVREIIKPDGSKETTTTTTEDTRTTKDTRVTETDQASKTTKETKEVTRAGSRANISLLAGMSPDSLGKVSYGVTANKEILGPVTVGVFGLLPGASPIVGASIGLNF